jgi:hypothetical protein
MWRAFLEGDPKALKAEDGTLRGEVSRESVVSASTFCGTVGVLSSSIGSSDFLRIWILCPCT